MSEDKLAFISLEDLKLYLARIQMIEKSKKMKDELYAISIEQGKNLNKEIDDSIASLLEIIEPVDTDAISKLDEIKSTMDKNKLTFRMFDDWIKKIKFKATEELSMHDCSSPEKKPILDEINIILDNTTAKEQPKESKPEKEKLVEKELNFLKQLEEIQTTIDNLLEEIEKTVKVLTEKIDILDKIVRGKKEKLKLSNAENSAANTKADVQPVILESEMNEDADNEIGLDFSNAMTGEAGSNPDGGEIDIEALLDDPFYQNIDEGIGKEIESYGNEP